MKAVVCLINKHTNRNMNLGDSREICRGCLCSDVPLEPLFDGDKKFEIFNLCTNLGVRRFSNILRGDL